MPLAAIDPLYYDKAYYLGPDKRGGKPYGLLTEALRSCRDVTSPPFRRLRGGHLGPATKVMRAKRPGRRAIRSARKHDAQLAGRLIEQHPLGYPTRRAEAERGTHGRLTDHGSRLRHAGDRTQRATPHPKPIQGSGNSGARWSIIEP